MTDSLRGRAALLDRRYADHDAQSLMTALITSEFPGRITLISSFGAESALLLSFAAEIDRDLPALFVDTGKIFPETLDYRNRLVGHLGLRNVRTIRPTTQAIDQRDPDGQLWHFDADACCGLRKVEPLALALSDFDAVISGRKRYHGALRQFMPRIEAINGRIKIDPLACWTREQVEAEFRRRDLPQHPLKAEGYASIGCQPCTIPIEEGAPIRSGRWAGEIKTECGIHLPVPGDQSAAS